MYDTKYARDYSIKNALFCGEQYRHAIKNNIPEKAEHWKGIFVRSINVLINEIEKGMQHAKN